MSTCPFCGWPDTDVYEIVSRHRTPEGETVWTHCACGSLQVRVESSEVVARGRPRAAVRCEDTA
ncbi:hypothetical protein [Prauserella cavernicola]|nr:hypothetical protein [Prauserella cavernicola]